jgi:hypothetical protein
MTAQERETLHELDAAERSGQVLTGAQRGILADLRRAEIIASVMSLVAEKRPGVPGIELRTSPQERGQ